MIKIEFEYGIDSEIQRVKNTLKDIEWLNENKYRFSLPAFESEPEKVSDKEIRDSVKKEYSALEFETAEKAVCSVWEEKQTKIEKIQNTIMGANKLDSIKIVFTKYGTSGSYWVPNKIIINLRANVLEFLIKTVIHESIHLMIENLIKKNNVTHWYKERIVDLIIDKEFQSTFRMQNLPEYTKSADAIFDKFYPNMIFITEEIAKLTSIKT